MLDMLKRSSFFIGIGVLFVIFLIFSQSGDDEEAVAVISNPEQAMEQHEEEFNDMATVDIKGEVNKPGVYELSANSRVNDVILEAGGFTADADDTVVNLAQKVHDEMIILVPKRGENEPAGVSGGGIDPANEKIRVNFATQEEIERLNGIGPAKAAAIIEYREENGPFQQAEDLLEISGIGEKTLEKIRDHLQIP